VTRGHARMEELVSMMIKKTDHSANALLDLQELHAKAVGNLNGHCLIVSNQKEAREKRCPSGTTFRQGPLSSGPLG